jgi:hypothetical protein
MRNVIEAKEKKLGKISVAKAEGGELLRFCRSARRRCSRRRDDALQWAPDLVGVFFTLIAGDPDSTLPLSYSPVRLPPCASRSSPPTRAQRGAACRTTKERQNKIDRAAERPPSGSYEA